MTSPSWIQSEKTSSERKGGGGGGFFGASGEGTSGSAVFAAGLAIGAGMVCATGARVDRLSGSLPQEKANATSRRGARRRAVFNAAVPPYRKTAATWEALDRCREDG